MQYTVTLLKVKGKNGWRDGSVFFLLLPRITSKAHPESLQFIDLFILSFNKYYGAPASCQALFCVSETQGERGKQHPCSCNRPVTSSLEVKSPEVEIHCIQTLISPAFAFT